jgi:type IV pilus assembly protein PilM
MAAANAVWGIDVGQCALKAMRCRLGDDGQSIIADAFDYIEYPKILTEPDANPEQLVRDALRQFLADNTVRDAKVAISVPGQSGLTRFIKLPPVEAKKIPDIVKYEAKQQIPFSLDDVIWDYQALLGGVQDEGVALETEVGLFAMKRDQVFRAIRPFRDAGIELDVVQLTPIAIYNAVVYGVLEGLPGASEYDPDAPPKSVAVISMGTDTTDLVVTNGFRIWQRSIPIGGSHFTKQLTKEMKLTFAKAEHLKRNARQAEDPKAVFQAMRPVFNDLVQELQRSLGYFRSIDRRAQISHAVALGNAMLLPGLEPYIEKNLDMPVKRLQAFRHLEGSSVVSTPKFKDNILSFPVSYGLCLQGLGKSRLSTNLIPREMVTSRLIRRKKPWALLALTVFLIGISFNFLFNWNRWRAAHLERFADVEQQVKTVSSTSNDFKSQDAELQQQFDNLKRLGNEVVGGADARFLVLELFKAINAALPTPSTDDPAAVSKVPYNERTEMYIESIDSEYFPLLSDYYTVDAADRYARFLKDLSFAQQRTQAGASQPQAAEAADAAAGKSAAGDEDGAADEGADVSSGQDSAQAAEAKLPELPDFARPGWVIQVKGYHCYDNGKDLINRDAQYLINTFMNELENGTVELPAGPGQPPTVFTMKELGIYCPLIAAQRLEVPMQVPDLKYDPAKSPPAATRSEGLRMNRDKPEIPMVNATVYEFTVQFMWLETRASERLEARKNKEQKASTDASGDVAGDF